MGGIALLLGKKPKGAGDGEADDAGESGEGKSLHKDAAGEVLAAIKSSDAGELSTALKNFIDLCSGEHGEEDEGDY